MNEIKINKPKDILNWNFKEYIPNFQPEQIPIGATISLPSGKDFFISEKHNLGSGKWSFIDKRGIDSIIYNDYLTQINNRKKPNNLQEIKVNKPVPTLDMFNNIKEKIYVILDTLEGADHDKLDKLYFDILMKATNGFGFDWNKLSDINKIEVYNQLKDLLSKNNSLHEIKVNRPSQIHDLDKPGNKFDNIKPGDVLQLSIPGDKGPVQQRVIGRKDDVIKTIDLVDGKEKQEAYDYWSKESLQNYYSHTHINEVKRLQQLAGINEIKITKPGIKLPIIVSEKEYLRIAPILTQQGYNWVGNKDRKVEDFNPWSLDQPMPDKIELYALGGDLLSWGTPEDLDEIKK